MPSRAGAGPSRPRAWHATLGGVQERARLPGIERSLRVAEGLVTRICAAFAAG